MITHKASAALYCFWVLLMAPAGCKPPASAPAAVPAAPPAAAPHARPVWIDLKVSKETTLLTEPLRSDGTVDYVAAINERFGKGVTPENNALVALLPAIGSRDSFSWNRDLNESAVNLAGGKLVNGSYVHWKTDVIGEPLLKLWEKFRASETVPWSAEECPEIDTWLRKNAEALDVICEASRRTRFWIPLVSRDGSLSQGVISATSVLKPGLFEPLGALRIRAMQKVKSGDHSGAWDDLLACHRMGQHFGQSWDLNSALVSMGNDEGTLRCDRALLEAAAGDRELLSRILTDLKGFHPPARRFLKL